MANPTTAPEPLIDVPQISREIAREIPKVSLHCHLLGSVPAATAVELARRSKVAIPGNPDAASIYDRAAYANLDQFLSVYDLIGCALQSRDDYRRVTYESLTTFGADHTVWYREIFVTPQLSPLSYLEVLAGITDGMNDAKVDTGIDSRIIMAINREHSATEAVEFVEQVIEHRTEEVIGIGLDYQEVKGPPARFGRAFSIAAAAGLERTAHSENGPPSNIEILLDELHCSRIDHGYHVVADKKIARRCAQDCIPFTCTPVASDITGYSGPGDGRHLRIKQMVECGLSICIDSDDPPMFDTNPSNDFYVLSNALDYQLTQLLSFTANAIDACWLDANAKKQLHDRLDHWQPPTVA